MDLCNIKQLVDMYEKDINTLKTASQEKITDALTAVIASEVLLIQELENLTKELDERSKQ